MWGRGAKRGMVVGADKISNTCVRKVPGRGPEVGGEGVRGWVVSIRDRNAGRNENRKKMKRNRKRRAKNAGARERIRAIAPPCLQNPKPAEMDLRAGEMLG